MSRKKRPPASKPDEEVRLREHVHGITNDEEYFGFLRRLRHARYSLDSLLQGGRLYGPSEVVEPLLEQASSVRPRFDDLELRATTQQGDGGRVERDAQALEGDQFEQLTRDQVALWQDTELIVAQVYEEMAASIEQQLVDTQGNDTELQILVSMLRFHASRRMDDGPPLRSYVFDFGVGELFEVAFSDHEPRRHRAEKWYDQALHAMAATADASRKLRESRVLVRLTWAITVLTVLIAALTAVMLWATFGVS